MEEPAPRPIYRQGLWIWWLRSVVVFVATLTLFTLALTALIWREALRDPTTVNLMLMLLTVLMSATLLLVAFLTAQRGRERVSWIALLPGDVLRVRTLNGTLLSLPAAAVGKRQYQKSGLDPLTGFSWEETRLILPISGGGSLHVDLVDGQILDEESFARLFHWNRDRPPVGGGRHARRHKKRRATAAARR